MKAKLIGQDGNVFNLLSICRNALVRAGESEKAKELMERAFKCGGYHEALALMMEYIRLACPGRDAVPAQAYPVFRAAAETETLPLGLDG
jgi:hypothetical protein